MNTPVLCAALLLGAASAHGEEVLARIARVTLYPSGATVQRELKVAAGAAQLEIACLPMSFDAMSLRVEGDAGVRVGDLGLDTVSRTQGERCRRSPLDDRIRTLEDQRAALEGESNANDVLLGYLKQLGGDGRGTAPDARTLAGTSNALRRTAQDVFAKQHRLKRDIEEVDRQLAPLSELRDRATAGATQWRTLRFAVQAERPATVSVSYHVPQAGWTPTYRARLDGDGLPVQFERRALVAQTSGEDWSGVRMTLSTGQPRQSPAGPLPGTWLIGLQPPMQAREKLGDAFPRAFAPAPAAAPVSAQAPQFDVSVFESTYATEFELPGPVDLASDGQRIGVTLARIALPATLSVRTAPRLDASAYLVAEAERPAGVWPPGPLELERDGALVGSTAWRPADGDKLVLPFGRDERVRVAVEGPKTFDEHTGLTESRIEHRQTVAFVVHNEHRTSIRLQVLEASPVSTSDQIKVRASFTPKPNVDAWERREGVVAWDAPLGAGESARFGADYVIAYPKDARISGLH